MLHKTYGILDLFLVDGNPRRLTAYSHQHSDKRGATTGKARPCLMR